MPHENCRDLLDGLSDYVDGEASAELCAKLRQHMADCEKCRIVVDTLSKTVKLYRILPKPGVSDAVIEHLFKTIKLSDLRNP